MKRFIICFIVSMIIAFSFVCVYCVFKKEEVNKPPLYNWQKLEGGAYMDGYSYEIGGDYKIATFKIYEGHNYFYSDDKKTDYKITRYKAFCNNTKTLGIISSKKYDEYDYIYGKYKVDTNVFKNYKDFEDGEFVYETLCGVRKYDKKDTITFNEYLYSAKKKTDILTINKNGDVTYNGKVVMSDSHKNKPLNDNTAYEYIELEVLFLAEKIKPKKGCNPNDGTNGIYGLGCYIDSN